MRLLLGILALLSLIGAQAQSWCAQGATWRYKVLFIHGYVEYTYAGDTLINGMEAQVIDHASVLQYPQPPPEPPSEPYYTYEPVAFITRNEGDLVFLWHHPSQAWDTLFWWGAQAGEGWTMAHGGEFCEPFEVIDTGTMEVDGVELRWLDLNNVSDRIVERIGCLMEFLPFCPPGHVDGLGGLRCYTDNEIHYQDPGWNYGCTSLVSVDGITAYEYNIHPNPGTTHFTLSLPPGLHTITLFDVTGSRVLELRTAEVQPLISTEELPTGMYTVRIVNRYGTVHHHQWIKS